MQRYFTPAIRLGGGIFGGIQNQKLFIATYVPLTEIRLVFGAI